MSSKKRLAQERWNILKQAILKKDSTFISAASVRRFDTFGFIKCEKIENYVDTEAVAVGDDEDENESNTDNNNENYTWYNVSVPSLSDTSVMARFYTGPISLNKLAGFNNTGNVCLWPSEEVMTYFCLKNGVIFEGKSVCELGGGMTCLCGLMISKACEPKEVFLTDGNDMSFENLEKICNENEFKCSVECCLLKWQRDTKFDDLEERFDYIICADCLFFENFREDLCETIFKLLKPTGMCLIFAPNRKNSFHKFVDLAKIHFECMIVQDYDDDIWETHTYNKENNCDYDEDIHYPLLLKLCKRNEHVGFCKMIL